MKFQEVLELREKVFRKMGWSKYKEMPFGQTWVNKSLDHQKQRDTILVEPLPPIETTWEICTEYLVPFMREKGRKYEIINHDLKAWFYWYWNGGMSKEIEIVNHNIARAACKAFLEVEINGHKD